LATDQKWLVDIFFPEKVLNSGSAPNIYSFSYLKNERKITVQKLNDKVKMFF